MSGRLDGFAGGGAAAVAPAAGAPAGGVACGAGAVDTPPRMRVKSLGMCAGAGGGADRTGGGSVGNTGAGGGAEMGAMGAIGATAGTGMKKGGGVMGDAGGGAKTGDGSVTGGTTIGTASATGGAPRARSTSVARPEFTGPGGNGSGAGSGIGGGANTGIEKGDGVLGAGAAAPLCDWNSRVNSPGCAAAAGGAGGGAGGGACGSACAGACLGAGGGAAAEPKSCVNSPGVRAAGCNGVVTGRGATGGGTLGAAIGAAVGDGAGAGRSWSGIEATSRGGAPRPASQLLSVAKPASSCVTTTTFPSTSTISSTRPLSGPGSRSIWSRTVAF